MPLHNAPESLKSELKKCLKKTFKGGIFFSEPSSRYKKAKAVLLAKLSLIINAKDKKYTNQFKLYKMYEAIINATKTNSENLQNSLVSFLADVLDITVTKLWSDLNALHMYNLATSSGTEYKTNAPIHPFTKLLNKLKNEIGTEEKIKALEDEFEGSTTLVKDNHDGKTEEEAPLITNSAVKLKYT